MKETIEALQADRVVFETCYAAWNNDELTVGNALIERRWEMRDGLLYPASLFDKQMKYEWFDQPSLRPVPYPAQPFPEEARRVEISIQQGTAGPTEESSLIIHVDVHGAQASWQYRLQIFSNASAITMQLCHAADSEVAVNTSPTDSAMQATGIEVVDARKADETTPLPDCLESFTLASPHMRLLQITLCDQTDIYNELYFEREWLLHTNEQLLQLSGNLFILEDVIRNSGVILVKHAPLPHARPVPCAYDMKVEGGRKFSWYGHGNCEDLAGYSYAVITYSGGKAGRIAALQSYQRQFRTYQPGRDGRFLSNTWGDRSQDSCIKEEFLLQEIAAGERLGIDVLQIDDGWQAGRTANSKESGGVWNGFWAANPHFWEPHTTRLPHGLEPIIARAQDAGIEVGLWFAPDSSDDFANWQRDADALVGLYQKYGVRYFKIDGVKAMAKLSEVRLRMLFDHVLAASQGEVVFDLDVTAEIRPGYFGLLHTGPIFVENRYTDWRRYWPHHTLRNLWKLAHVVDPRRMRIEMLNNARNTEKYQDDPIAPAAYRPAYLFATTMFANPLGWFEISHLPEAYITEVAALAHVWKAHRDDIFCGTIFPIAEAPDGTAWTGFLSLAADKRQGHLLLFREYNARPGFSTNLPMVDGTYHCTSLAGQGSMSLVDGILQAEIPEKLDFLFVKIIKA